MGKLPYIEFYPNDWTHDLQEHPLDVQGAWMLILCKLHWSETRGQKTLKLCQWSKVLSVKEDRAADLLCYIKASSLGQVLGHIRRHNANITVISRRMIKDDKAREQNKLRQRRYREKA